MTESTPTQEELQCSFCGISKTPPSILIKGHTGDVFICPNCIAVAHSVVMNTTGLRTYTDENFKKMFKQVIICFAAILVMLTIIVLLSIVVLIR